MSSIDIPPIGPFTFNSAEDCFESKPVKLSLLGGQPVAFVLEGYEDDSNPDEFRLAIRNLIEADQAVLQAVTADLHRFYLDTNDNEYREPDDQIEISSPSGVWQNVKYGDRIVIERRGYGDEKVYASLECDCDWEEEHGLQIVLRNGNRVCKVGPYDGHLTNSDAYDDESFEDVVYVPVDQL